MASRLELHEELCELLESRHVYFQPPESVKLVYPCIVYGLSGIDQLKANDRSYKTNKRYDVTIIDYDPDSELPDKILDRFVNCSFDRSFVSDNLNHWVFTLYY